MAESREFGLCSICGEENDLAEESLVTVICNQKSCVEQTYHQPCIIDLVDQRSASRRTFYLKKQSHFDLAGFYCPQSRYDVEDERHCKGKISESVQHHQLKKVKKSAVVAAAPAPPRDVTCGARKAPRTGRLPSLHVPVGRLSLPTVSSKPNGSSDSPASSSPRTPPVGGDWATEDEPPSRAHSSSATSSPREPPAGKTPWWCAPAPPRPGEVPARSLSPVDARIGGEPSAPVVLRETSPDLPAKSSAPSSPSPPPPPPLPAEALCFAEALSLSGALLQSEQSEGLFGFGGEARAALAWAEERKAGSALRALKMLAESMRQTGPMSGADASIWLVNLVRPRAEPCAPAAAAAAAAPEEEEEAEWTPVTSFHRLSRASSTSTSSLTEYGSGGGGGGGGNALSQLASDTRLRALFKAALSTCAARGLLPLPNASRLSDVMANLDSGWVEARRRHAPFSRLFWAFASELREARLALVPGENGAGFALVRIEEEGAGAGAGAAAAGGPLMPPMQQLSPEEEAMLVCSYERKLVDCLRDGEWMLLSILGEKGRGAPVPPELKHSLKAFLAVRPDVFDLEWEEQTMPPVMPPVMPPLAAPPPLVPKAAPQSTQSFVSWNPWGSAVNGNGCAMDALPPSPQLQQPTGPPLFSLPLTFDPFRLPSYRGAMPPPMLGGGGGFSMPLGLESFTSLGGLGGYSLETPASPTSAPAEWPTAFGNAALLSPQRAAPPPLSQFMMSEPASPVPLIATTAAPQNPAPEAAATAAAVVVIGAAANGNGNGATSRRTGKALPQPRTMTALKTATHVAEPAAAVVPAAAAGPVAGGSPKQPVTRSRYVQYEDGAGEAGVCDGVAAMRLV